MKLIIDKEIDAEVIHHYDENLMITSKCNVITIKHGKKLKKINLPLSSLKKLLSIFRLFRRALRTDKSVFVPMYFDGKLKSLFGVYQGNFYKILWPSMVVKKTGCFRQGRVPLHQGICQTEKGDIFVGEYSPNKMNISSAVWKSNDAGDSWNIVFEFPREKARHIHGCFWDPVEKKVWVCTGDFKGECHIVCADEDFVKVEWLSQGSQKWRTVNLIFKKNYVYFGMDSPLTQSYICRIDRSNRKLEQLTQVPGPIWYAKALQDDWMLFACSVEDGPSVLDNYARIFATKDGIHLHNVFEVEKDNWPYLFKLGVISFATGEQDISHFYIFSEALKGFDGKGFQCHLSV